MEAWNSLTTNSAKWTLLNHMEQHDNNIVAPDTPTHYPDIHHHNFNVLNITLLQTENIQYSIQNINDLSSDHNPVLNDINAQFR